MLYAVKLRFWVSYEDFVVGIKFLMQIWGWCGMRNINRARKYGNSTNNKYKFKFKTFETIFSPKKNHGWIFFSRSASHTNKLGFTHLICHSYHWVLFIKNSYPAFIELLYYYCDHRKMRVAVFPTGNKKIQKMCITNKSCSFFWWRH